MIISDQKYEKSMNPPSKIDFAIIPEISGLHI